MSAIHLGPRAVLMRKPGVWSSCRVCSEVATTAESRYATSDQHCGVAYLKQSMKRTETGHREIMAVKIVS